MITSFKLAFVCLSYDLVYKSSNFPADSFTFIIMNVMSAVQEYCLCVRLFGKCPFMLNPSGGYLPAIGYEHQNRARNGSCRLHKPCVFQHSFRLVLVTGIHCVSSSQKPMTFDFIPAQPTIVKRVPEEHTVLVECSHPSHEMHPLINLFPAP